MPDPVFEVTCYRCGRTLVKTDLIRCGDVAIIRDHVRVCCRLDPIGDAAPLGTILAKVRVTSAARE